MRAPASVSERGPLNAEIVTVRSCRAIKRPRFLFAQTDREHRAFAARATFHEARPQRDDARRFFHAENARDAGRRNFADTVADDRRWLDAPGFPKLGERHLHRENRGLRDLRPLHLGGFLGAAEFFEQGKSRPRTHRGVAALDASRGRPARAASARGPCPTIAGLVRS